jgi:hypothetical protein
VRRVDPDRMSVRDAAWAVERSRNTIRRWVDNGSLQATAIALDGQEFFALDDVLACRDQAAERDMRRQQNSLRTRRQAETEDHQAG